MTEKYVLETSIGKLTGLVTKDKTSGAVLNYRYANIPYSKPIDGKDRFQKPIALPGDFDYSGDYTQFGLSAPQPEVSNENLRKVMPQEKGDENINYVNIWVPNDVEKPEGGFPVLIYIHGGWLQYGNPSKFPEPVELQSEKSLSKYIIVTPGYRLNVLGFLNSTELATQNISNLGFWDQRLSIEWVFNNIKHFGGNPDKITLSGLSAGSYSTFFQLAYEIYHPETVTQIIKQTVHISNAIFVQPKLLKETDEQYEELLKALNIDLSFNVEDKLEKLRSFDVDEIIDAIPKLKFHTFRAVSDGDFVSLSIIRDLKSGEFTKQLLKVKGKNFRTVIGEVENEPYLYSVLDTPDNLEELVTQLENYYPRVAIKVLLSHYHKDDGTNYPASYFKELFGKIVSDGQVYSSSRGYVNNLVGNGFPAENVFRYRVAFRPKFLDTLLDPLFGVIHGLDHSVWFLDVGSLPDEKRKIITYISPFNDILSFFKEIKWATTTEKQYRYLSPSGETAILDDQFWEWGVKVANDVYDIQIS